MKITGDSSQAPAFNPAKNTGKTDFLPVKQTPVETSIQNTKLPTAGLKLSNILAMLKLPQDNLSRSIIAFARFFSLPLESKFLHTLRKDALQAGKGAAFRESAALGFAAAADKGLKLQGKALAEYAAAIEGSIKVSIKSFSKEGDTLPRVYSVDKEQEHDSAEPDRGGSENQGQNNSQPDQSGGNFRHNERQNPREKRDFGKDIHDHLIETLNDKPMLDLINRIPGKKGRWIVIPFSFLQKGFEYNVSLRILLYDNMVNSAKPAVFERLTADITVKEIQKRWFISLERPKSGFSGNEAAGLTGSRIHIFSEIRTPADKNRIRRELAKALNLPLDNVEFCEEPPLFADSREDHLRSVDEEV